MKSFFSWCIRWDIYIIPKLLYCNEWFQWHLNFSRNDKALFIMAFLCLLPFWFMVTTKDITFSHVGNNPSGKQVVILTSRQLLRLYFQYFSFNLNPSVCWFPNIFSVGLKVNAVSATFVYWNFMLLMFFIIIPL